MSMRHERTRAVIETQKFLEELRFRGDVPADVRQSAVWCLRHYPMPAMVKSLGYSTMPSGLDSVFGTSVDFDEDKANMERRAKK